jgi:transposase
VKQSPLELIPAETKRAARAVFHSSNWYIRIGDQLHHVLAGIPSKCLTANGSRPAEFSALLALITIFQIHEHLSDLQAEDAGRMRIDWKYALHLPMFHPGLQAYMLCDFRLKTYASSTSRDYFQKIISNMDKLDLWEAETQKDAGQVVHSICTFNRLESVRDKMAAALEIIALKEPGWLRESILSHWYSRYTHKHSKWMGAESNTLAVANALGKDILYLLTLMQSSGLESLASLKEVEVLRQALHEQYTVAPDGNAETSQLRWREKNCIFYEGGIPLAGLSYRRCYEANRIVNRRGE